MLEIVSNDDAGESKIEEDPNLKRPREKLKLDVHVEDQEEEGGGVALGVERKDLLEMFDHGGELKIEEDSIPKKRKCELDNHEDREDKEASVMLGLEKKSLQEIARVDEDDGESKLEEDVNLKKRKELDDYVEDQEDKEGGVVLGVERKDLLEIFDDGGELKNEEDLNLKKRKCELNNYEEDKAGGVMLGLEKKSLQEVVRVDEDDGESKLAEDVNLKKCKEELDDYVDDQEDKEGGLALDSTSSCVEKKEVAVRSRPRLPFSSLGRRDSDSDFDFDDREEQKLRLEAFLERRKREGPVRELIDKDRGKTGEFTKKEVDNVELQPHEYQNLPVPEEELKYCQYRAQYYADKPEPYRPLTSKEREVYTRQLRESEGFDCPFTRSNGPGLRVKEILLGENAMKIAKYSKLALLYFNNRHGTDYAFERIEKANSHSSSVATYYITFVAESGETFQARVHEKLMGDIDVLFCRIKPGQCATA